MIRSTRKYLDVKWEHQGRSQWGLDCIGVHVLALRDLGITVPDDPTYGPDPDGRTLARIMDSIAPRLETFPVYDPNKTTYVGFWIKRRGVLQHLALLTDIGILHAWSEPGKVTEHTFDDKFWKKRVVAAWQPSF